MKNASTKFGFGTVILFHQFTCLFWREEKKTHTKNGCFGFTTRYGLKCANVNNNLIFNVFKLFYCAVFWLLDFYLFLFFKYTCCVVKHILHANSLNSHLNKCYKSLSMLVILRAKYRNKHTERERETHTHSESVLTIA